MNERSDAAGTTSATKTASLRQMRALSHPTRMRILSMMDDRKARTVGDIAAAIGESAGTVSYHLHRLEQAGLVEHGPSPDGDARKSCWKASQRGIRLDIDPDAIDPTVSEALIRATRLQHRQALERYGCEAASLPDEWREAALDTQSTISLTSDEFRSMTDELLDVIDRWTAISGQHGDGDGSERIMMAVNAFRYLP
ncbi:helix-turn-helix domain-containing protein [Bifidobacterium samirii]|uniref:Transcriptional regulator n=1 Tax=Bifidobacterium samirii TaxID=2306974 RepID=A0A430FRB9_9BIFI|nr:helix-turn-helix domain-containing protein [Bifidobacterium samirii]RSX55366.1 transcriptional regulator [Bifidobacterium samirii]